MALGAMRRKLKQAARSMLFRNRRKGWNGWIAMMVEKAAKMMLLRSAAASFANRAARAGWNGWVAMREDRLRKLRAMEHALLCFTQMGIRRGFRAWFPLLRLRQAFKRAALSFANRESRKGFNGWLALILRRRNLLNKMRGTAVAFMQGAYHSCWYTWKRQYKERAEVREARESRGLGKPRFCPCRLRPMPPMLIVLIVLPLPPLAAPATHCPWPIVTLATALRLAKSTPPPPTSSNRLLQPPPRRAWTSSPLRA